MKRYYTALLLTLSLSSCDMMVRVSGIVTDAQTGKPLPEVEYAIVNSRKGSISYLTDSIGKFEFYEIRSGFIGTSKKVKLSFQKDYFQKQTVILKAGDNNVVIKLKREDSSH
ncbi:hypothetical protein ACR78F_11680 [Sphingobacterium spiritivorum]|uniref:hypothetical protein n=1 Tax=Sphingobacterium spiritivorum TaxID=258 RepID=UPI003DA6C32C